MSFIGIGLGPGKRDLITLKAVDTMKSIDVALAAASRKTGKSYALEIAEEYINPSAEIVKAYFSMTGVKEETEKSYLHYIELIKEKVDAGKNVGFLCIGDPLFYGTYGRLIQLLRKRYPQIPIATIPGVPAFCAAAARANRVIALENEILSVVPANTPETVKKAGSSGERLVIMKLYRDKNRIIEELDEMGYKYEPLYVEKSGLAEEYVTDDMEEIKRREPTYLSLLFINRKLQ
jgi:precorrin-2/cobalt-factor-2 C20-methyltransferase